MTLCDRIKKRRIELNMSQEELASKVGYTSRSTINKIEMGKIGVKIDKLVNIAKALNTSVSYLLGNTDNPDEDSKFTQAYDFFALRNTDPSVNIYEKAKNFVESGGEIIKIPDSIELDFSKISKKSEKLKKQVESESNRYKWSDNFKKFLKNYLDSNGEIGCFVREDLYDFTNGLNDLSYPSFDLYCGLADYLHLSVDEMIGLNNKKTEENSRVKEFQELFSNLTAEQQAIVIAQIKGILSSKE